MAIKSRSLRKWKRKKWVDIIAPQYFGNLEIGSTPAENPKNTIGRNLGIKLSDLTKDSRHKNIKVFFKVNDVKEGKALAKFFGHKLDENYIRRIVRNRKDRIDVIVDVETKDGKKIRVKALLITIKKAKSSQNTALRKTSEKIIEDFASKNGFGEFVYKMLVSRLAKKIRKEANKIYPLSNVEIRKSEVL